MFCSDGSHFQKNYSMTAGVELLVKSVNIPETSDSVWGQPSVVCLVFEISSLDSFKSCSRWLERVRAHCNGLQLPGVLVGNKSDLASRREVETSVAQEWAREQGLQYHETSAKEMENCDAPFMSLAQAFYALYQDRRQMIQRLVTFPLCQYWSL
ncbi:hypothetical protein QTP86_018975 [Hemibagrus guttatus]|nr:hypothetical protein QTP86_018975 [Hemibagrus guttatus]